LKIELLVILGHSLAKSKVDNFKKEGISGVPPSQNCFIVWDLLKPNTTRQLKGFRFFCCHINDHKTTGPSTNYSFLNFAAKRLTPIHHVVFQNLIRFTDHDTQFKSKLLVFWLVSDLNSIVKLKQLKFEILLGLEINDSI
jgi:hypothetical protein